MSKLGWKPLTEEQQTAIKEVLEQSARTIEEHLEESSLAPHRNFVAAAVAAGFSEAQAEFLWSQQLSSRPLF